MSAVDAGHRAAILAAALDPLSRIFAGFTMLVGAQWPVEAFHLPAILVHAGDEALTDASGGNGPPAFAVTMPLVVRVRQVVPIPPADLPDGAAHGVPVERQVGIIGEALKAALLADPAFVALFDGIGPASLERQVAASGEDMLLEVALSLTCRWQEVFPPRLEDGFTALHLRLDAIEPADRAGTYPPAPPFPPAAAAPRPAGPDGRAEAGFALDLPT